VSSNNFIEIDYDVWLETYKPILNHIDTNASFDGMMFETYGDEVEFVKSQSPDKIWMYGDGDSGNSYIWSGWGFVNRIGYFITEVPCPPNTDIQIKVGINWYYCETCDIEMEDEDSLINDKFYDLGKCPNCVTTEELKELETQDE
jgi:hypothetical protein